MGVRSEFEVSDLVDPLADYSSLSLFPRSFTSSSFSNPNPNPNPNSSISDSLLTHLKSKGLSSPDKLLKQAKPIVEDSLNYLKTDKKEAMIIENDKVLRERRPGLGLKRTKFSLKPMRSQPDASLDFSIDVAKLSDPVEFFAAVERMENAKKEVQRLKGEPLMELDLKNVSLAPRRRRPSLLGRSATYTHRQYPSLSTVDVDETPLPSQATYDNDIRSPTRNDVLPDANVMKYSPSVRVSDSQSNGRTSKVSELDELLSLNYEGLDENEVENLLRDKLQIKDVDIGKAVLPKWRVHLRDSLTSSSALPKMNDIIFRSSDMREAVRSKDKVSPAKSKSPLASISLLNKQVAKRTPSKDPFSPLHFDSSLAETTGATREPEKRVDQAGESVGFDAKNNLSECRRSPAHGEENIAGSVEDPFGSAAVDGDPISEPKEKEGSVGQFDQIGNCMNSRDFGRSPIHAEESIAVSIEGLLVLAPTDVGPATEPEKEDNAEVAADRLSARQPLLFEGHTEPEIEDDEQVAAAQLSVRQQLLSEGLDMEKSSSDGVEKGGTSEPSNTDNISVEEPTKESRGSSKRKLKEREKSMATSKAGVEETVTTGTQAEKSQLDVLGSINARSKKRKVRDAQPRCSKRDLQLRRSSLYCAGTKWEEGVRRSSRIRMRPLEYWRGERFLYGRVHESLVTVIGVKYASPSKDSKEPSVKVKSFVSDDYKDMVELAALH